MALIGCDVSTVAKTLGWVKIRSMQVFWPACVYKSYSAAVAHTHDVWPLRNEKPVLDTEDRVIYFFGVGPRACHVVATGSSPNLQLCVAHKDDFLLETWTTADEFLMLCAKYQIPEDNVKRAQSNFCFLRACDEATTYYQDVQIDEQAAELFVTLLTTAKMAHKTGKAVVVRKIISSPVNANIKNSKQTKCAITGKKAVDMVELLKAPAMTTIVAKCWQQMLEAGWETMTQGDGQVLYRMPGTSFFDLVPNVNLFDSLEKACKRYLSELVSDTIGEAIGKDFLELTELLWPLAASSGWESMVTTTETLYKKVALPFDQWVPNVTIFRSKSQAVAKYLEECGLTRSIDDADFYTHKLVSDATRSDDEIEEPVPEDEEKLILGAQAESDDNDGSVGKDCDDNLDKQDEKDTFAASVKLTASKKRVAMTITKPLTLVRQTKPEQRDQTNTTNVRKAKRGIPHFKMAFGKLESELKRRGWYWKSGGLQWKYFQPYCKTKDVSTLKPKIDYFRGREELEEYLDRSGEYELIRAKLEEDHIRRYASDSDSEIDDEDAADDENFAEEARTYGPRSSKGLVRTHECTLKSVLKSKPTRSLSRKSLGRSESLIRSGCARSKSSARVSCGLSSQTTLGEVKFGEIWRILSDDGWHYRYGNLGCDYFKPHCATTKDGTPGVDYFQTKDHLIEYLQTSGIWNKTAARVRAEAAMDSSDIILIESDVEAAASARKRKRDDSTPALHPDGKNVKNSFRTPNEKESATIVLSGGDQELETISPDAEGVKGKEYNGMGRQPLRNLANCFTPSPSARPKEKSLQCSRINVIPTGVTKEASPSDLVQIAIQKLTAAYTPTVFRHREGEFDEISKFFTDCFKGDEKSSLYISGAPGCGKTALLKATQSEIDELYREICPEQAKEPIRCHFNAMALADASALYRKLAEAITNKSFLNRNEAFEAIERATSRNQKSYKTMILILDEIDILLKNNQIEDDLCGLFDLAHRTTNSFILIGIANQVDFTERHLPMLQQRLLKCSPRVVIFEPYNHQTIEQILIDRLGGQTEAFKMVSSHGISFLARKIASTTGDIRLAVGTCRRVLQHKLEQADKENLENPSDNDGTGRPLPLTDMLRIIKHALESKSALAIRSLPRNLQMILFASTRLLNVMANRASENKSETMPLISVDELFTCYCEVSKDAGVFKPLSVRDFRNALDTLSEEGLIAEAELRKHLIKVLCSTSELLQSFRKDSFFSRLV